jgi:hypothetical protein
MSTWAVFLKVDPKNRRLKRLPAFRLKSLHST